MGGFRIDLDVDKEDLVGALMECFPDLKLSVDTVTEQATSDADYPTPEQLPNAYKSKCAELQEQQRSHIHALQSIKALQEQQQSLFNEFATLRGKYDELKSLQAEVLWEHTALYHPDMKNIPSRRIDSDDETEERIGSFVVGETLGEGQFATVKACQLDSKQLALKIIKKNRILSLNAMKRVSNEIGTLRELRKNKHVVQITDALQSRENLYIVTEVGGPDLFDFFDEHPGGVQENWAQDIVFKILSAVKSCHDVGICHLDLKPENILLEFDYDLEQCTEVKLCDFGLCAKMSDSEMLTNFCGSPGFFAPEMVTLGKYWGQCADMWSVGCILLEMVLGHEKFCDAWMAAYDYDSLQDPDKFASLITTSVEDLPAALVFSTNLNEFLVRCLKLQPNLRLDATKALVHPWLEQAAAKYALVGPSNSTDNSTGSEDSSSLDINKTASSSRPSSGKTPRDKPMTVDIHNTISNRERQKVADYNEQHHDIVLPPIEPGTPSMGNARKILKQGQSLATKAEMGFPNGLNSPKTSRAASIDEQQPC